MEKVEKIRNSIKQTKERRKNQVCKVYQVKLQNLSSSDIQTLERMFLEAKWLYNYVVADIENRLNNRTWKLKEVEIKTPNGIEKRKIKILGSQIRQGIIGRIKNNLKVLKRLKEKGHKVGKLKFKSEVRSIPLVQYGVTYKILGDKNRVKIQGIKKKFRVLGLHQIPKEAELANAYLVKKPSGYCLHITCYIPKELNKPKYTIPKPIGIDFGVKNQLTLSNGLVIKWQFPETKRLKKLQRELARKRKGSKNYLKTKHKLQKEWEYITNIRKDIRNKVYALLRCYGSVVIQDENIKGWHSGFFGKQVQSTGIGGLISRLKHNLETLILVDRFEATTKICSNCGHIQQVKLSDRTFKCEKCGFEIDRDLNAAINILKKALTEESTSLNNLPLGWREVTPVEREVTAKILGFNPYILVNSLVEAGSSSL